jgi:hypothetical protein
MGIADHVVAECAAMLRSLLDGQEWAQAVLDDAVAGAEQRRARLQRFLG